MDAEQIIAIVTPILSGIGGILTSLAIFISRIRYVVEISKKAIQDNEDIKVELAQTKKAFIDLNQKVCFLVEDAKARAKDAEKQQ